MLPVVMEPVTLAVVVDRQLEPMVVLDTSDVLKTAALGFVVTDATISPFSSRLIVMVSFCKAVPRSDILTICLPEG